MTEDKQFVLQLCPNARAVALLSANGIRWVGTLQTGFRDKLHRGSNEDEVWAHMKKELNFIIMRKLEE